MEPSVKPEDQPSVQPEEQPIDKKEPLFTGHRTHDELVEKARIERPIRSYGHGIPIFPQAMIYILIFAAAAIVLFALVWSR
jgi:hypothetical protein